MKRVVRWCVLVLPAVLTDSHSTLAEEPPAAATLAADDFFEKEVRPLFTNVCGECHGPDKQEADLRLDSREAVLKGGATGPAIVPGDPEQSLLISAIRQGGDLQMPPDGKLSDAQIAALEHWVKSGASWPASDSIPAEQRKQAQRDHWAFQPIGHPTLPAVRDAAWCRTPIDAFLLAELESRGLRPSPPADRRTLIRRLSYDLIGLPPTAAEVEQFVSDPATDAYAKLVDRLLASPHYGEQWARHWLDVARYSDTKGYVYAREERFFVHAPVYRDWVVRAFNEDVPYDKFLLLQIAADQVAPNDPTALAALGYLTLGRRFLGVTHDIVDDQIDVVSRGMLGLTVACARCHDHKFDPIPTRDYYSLSGVFRNCFERFVPIADTTLTGAARAAFEKELQARQQALQTDLAKNRAEAATRVRQRVADYLMTQLEADKYPEENFNQILAKEDIIPAFVRRWQLYLDTVADADDPVFLPWHRFASLPADEFSARAAEVTRSLAAGGDGEDSINRLVTEAFQTPPTSMSDVAERYGRLFDEIDRQWQELTTKPGATALPDSAAEELRHVLYGARSPCEVPDEGIVSNEMYFDTATIEHLWKLQGDVDRWLIQSTEGPANVVALVDREWIEEPRVFRRGNPATKGDKVLRQFLEILAGPQRKAFSQGSGRLELAQAVVATDNPLTARVWVNRIWMHHFGEGLVRTPSDFGLRSEPPSHPALLDWLAQQLMSEGWSTKSLHRLIVSSAAYQQRSDRPEDAAALMHTSEIDPQNRLLWRMPVRRLSFEEWRDTLLTASGELDGRLGGRAAELFPEGSDNLRRTLYGLVDRQFLASALRMFDFANPDLHIPQRSETTVSQQALFAMNHPFVGNRARGLIAQVNATSTTDPADRVRELYRRAFQRDPTESQLQAALDFLALPAAVPPPVRPETRAWQYGYGTLTEAEGRVEFHALPHFTSKAWQGGPEWPDAALGWVQLTADGGHAGNDLQHAAVRRWKAVRDGTITIKSTVKHEVAAGDGIRSWIVSSRHGVLNSAVVHNRQQTVGIERIDVQAGDTVDLIVDFHADLNSDQFLMKAEISEVSTSAIAQQAAITAGPTWDSSRDFAGKSPDYLDAWAQLAQVLLMSNELMFVD